MSKEYELTEQDRMLLEEIEESLADGEGREEGALHGLGVRLASTVPRADDAFRERLASRLVARMQQRTAHEADEEVTGRRGARRWFPLGRLLAQIPSPATGLGWAVTALILCLFFGTVTYAVVPAVSRLFQLEDGLQHVEQADLVQELDLSQTMHGVTVTLERAYADANRIVVDYTVKHPDDQRYEASRLTLTDADGNVFPRTVGWGASGRSDLFGIELPEGEGNYVNSFDAASVKGAPAELDLRLAMELREFVLPTDTPGTSVGSSSAPAEPAEPMVVELEPMPQGDVVGTFAFDFSVPFIPGRVVEVDQTVETAGVAMRLERVVVTPSEARAYLRFDPPTEVETSWTSIVTLRAPDDRKTRGDFYAVADDSPVHVYGFPAPLHERQGEWTLKVTELVGTELVPPYEQVRLAGPWEFRFRVP
ncbi:MAG: DUF4179 domain-containing protein [Anaerolineae bacterium]